MASEGLTKSAILLMALGENEAAEVFKHLGPREVQKIGSAMANLKSVTREEIKTVIGEFCTQAGEQSTLSVALVGASGSGKTTLIEVLSVAAQRIEQRGHVGKGTTLCDYLPQERALDRKSVV